mgnify:CR=1 FL=1
MSKEKETSKCDCNCCCDCSPTKVAGLLRHVAEFFDKQK